MEYNFLLDKTYAFLKDNIENFLVIPYTGKDRMSVIDQMIFAIKSRTVKPIYKVLLLNHDESIREDITEYVLDGGSISVNFQNGVRRNANITLNNSDNKWNPSPTKNLWKDTKIRIDLGIKVSSGEVWKRAGVYIPLDISISGTQGEDTVSLQLSDKFASLDGTSGGKIATSVTIALNSNIKDAISTLLESTRMGNIPYDVKPIRFPPRYINEETAYTITKTDETTVGDIILELADMLSCDVYYDEYGYLTIEEGNYTMDVTDRENIWDFNENDLEFLESPLTIEFSSVYNEVTVIGSNVNGKIMSWTAQNTNPKSPTNIWNLEKMPLRIKDENIYSEKLARQRAEYELFKQGLLPLKVSGKCSFMPQLDVNKVVTIFNSKYNIKHTPFLIHSLNIPLSQQNNDISLTVVNTMEVTM